MKFQPFELPRFSKDRREGLARSMDNMATTALVTATVGLFRPLTMSMTEVGLLLLASFWLYTSAFFTREG